MAIMKLGFNIGIFDFESLDQAVKSIRSKYVKFKSSV